MIVCVRSPFLVAGAALALGLSAPGASAQAYMEPMFGIGFVANAPHMKAGGAVWGVIPGLRGFGLYVDFKTSVGSAADKSNFEDGLTVADVRDAYGDELFDQEDDWRSVNAAIVRPLTPELTVYVGGGIAWNTHYQEFWDPGLERGDFGWYWVEDPDASESRLNVMGGGMLRIAPRVRIQFGGELAPAGFTVGLSIVQPAR